MIPSPTSPLKSILLVMAVAAFITPSFAAGIPPYGNYTVGGDSGRWYFNSTTMTSGDNYTSWSSSISFYLGDFLIFNSNSNSTVIQTYNATTYKLCSIEQDYGKLTSQYGVEDAEDDGASGAIPVLLKREGDNYFFSSSENGLQCRKGMRFHIVVQHGNGLRIPSPPAPPPARPVSSPAEMASNDGGAATRWNVAFGLLMIWTQFA